ncbi:MAG: hypothetical protein ACYDAC_00985 [Candidatus Dormibacteria bacterium]
MKVASRAVAATAASIVAMGAGAVAAHGAAGTITATPTPFAATEQVDFTHPGLGGCSVPPPPVIHGCTAPQADCNFFGIDAARFKSSRAGATQSDFSVSASFSDGTSGAGLALPASIPDFEAVVEHPAFPEPMSLTVNVTITDRVDGSSVTVTTPMSITERVIRADGCQSHAATVGRPINGLPVAIVLDSEQGSPDINTVIAWGDGSTSPGTWQATDEYPYADLVTGSHTYRATGRYRVTTTLIEPGIPSSQATVSSLVTVSSAIPVPPTGAGGHPDRVVLGFTVVGLCLIAASFGAGRQRRRGMSRLSQGREHRRGTAGS